MLVTTLLFDMMVLCVSDIMTLLCFIRTLAKGIVVTPGGSEVTKQLKGIEQYGLQTNDVRK